MNEFQGIDTLLELEVLIWKLGLVIGLAQLLPDHLLRASSEGREIRTVQMKISKFITMSVGGLLKTRETRQKRKY